jgi:molecular chaperone DnaK (HSP70)
MEKSFAIGIDLGTTTTRVAVCKDGIPTAITHESGLNSIPSFVSYTSTDILIGNYAKNQVNFNRKKHFAIVIVFF